MNTNQKALIHLKDIIGHLSPIKVNLISRHNKFREDFNYSLKSAKAAVLKSVDEFQLDITPDLPLEHLLRKNTNLVAGLLDQVRELRYDDQFKDPEMSDLLDAAEDTLTGLINELQNKYNLMMNSIADPAQSQPAKANADIQKTVLSLSGDQIAIFLRAAKEEDIILSRSVSSVFSTIIPYLSTQDKETLSTTLRTKAYQAEDRDKEIVIDLLHKLAKRIESF